MTNDNIAFRRLTDGELISIKNFLKGKKKFTFEEVDDFMQDQNKKFGLFDNCTATVCSTTFIVQRPVGW